MSNAQIEKRLEMLEKAEQEYKTQKEMLNDALANDSELVELDEKLKEAKRRHLAQKKLKIQKSYLPMNSLHISWKVRALNT
jgi:hypothetical protein